jgi:hypothetical protein
MDTDEGALQIHRLDPVRAEAFSTLRYRFRDFPRTLELVLVFRTERSPDVVTVTIPTVASGIGTVDLASIPEWQGRILEIGFAQYPGAQSVPPASAFRPFRLLDVELWSPSWAGALAARMQDWLGARSWVLRSLNALGPDSVLRTGRSLVLFVFVGAIGTLVILATFLGWRRRKLAQAAVIGSLLAWLLLDLRWLHGLHARHAATREAYAELSPEERQRRLPDQMIFDSAQMLRNVLAGEDRRTRIVVDAGSDFERARLLYHLLPLNVAPMNMIWLDTAVQHPGLVLEFFRQDEPKLDAADSTLMVGDRRVPVVVLFDLGPLRVYRVRSS